MGRATSFPHNPKPFKLDSGYCSEEGAAVIYTRGETRRVLSQIGAAEAPSLSDLRDLEGSSDHPQFHWKTQPTQHQVCATLGPAMLRTGQVPSSST